MDQEKVTVAAVQPETAEQVEERRRQWRARKAASRARPQKPNVNAERAATSKLSASYAERLRWFRACGRTLAVCNRSSNR
jgi:hypothetical protein